MHGEYSMSTTLTNGLKLPDKGSVDWYADMQSNYTILDGTVGTVASHTTQIAGKAPLVHTHTKADITDFPVYGTTAGTICEGNDSRLSDARTPVAHTHTKSDVTDLFNSANTWTNTNTFQQDITYERTNFFHKAANPNYYLTDTGLEIGTVPNTPHTAYPGFWRDKNNQNLGYVRFVQYDSGLQTLECDIRNTVSNGSLDPEGSLQRAGFQLVNNPASPIGSCNVYANVLPNSVNTYDLGSASKQWLNTYSKGYYYNGVAWGLDKANTWTGNNTFSLSSLYQKGFSSRASAPASHEFGQFNIVDTNNNPVMSINYANRSTGSRDISLRVYDNAGNANGVGVFKDVSNNYSFCSINPSNTISLGTSDNKWKTLNGINPGALSLPKGGNIENTDWFDISSHITNVSGNAGANSYEAPSDGWIVILGKDEATSSIFIWNRANSGICASAYGNGTQGVGRLAAILPVRKGMNMGIICKFSSASDLYLARFYPCEGNV